MALTIRVLLENHLARGADSGLRAKAGLSLLIEDETTAILFDTGPDDSFQRNAAQMGISLDNLTVTVLSHGHYDHCGGVPWLPDNSRIICHPTIGNERYAALSVAGRSHKIKKLSLEIDYARHRMEYTRTPLHISDPPDGPTQKLLDRLGRHGNRPAHIHFFVSAPGHKHLTSQINLNGDKYLWDDFAFATRDGLIADPVKVTDRALIQQRELDGEHTEVHFDLTLCKALSTDEEQRGTRLRAQE